MGLKHSNVILFSSNFSTKMALDDITLNNIEHIMLTINPLKSRNTFMNIYLRMLKG